MRTTFMASIVAKKRGKNVYYYYVESVRKNGKPTIANQKYLGTASAVKAKLEASVDSLQANALYSDISQFGDIAFLYDIARRNGIIDLIDNVLPKRKQGASVGTYLLVEALNRATAPTSTVGLEKWYQNSCLPEILGFKPSVFSPQNFWNNTAISKDRLAQAEEALLRQIVTAYNLDTSHIVYDATNFLTYIDTANEACTQAQRGHSKEKRKDLRIVGLSMMIASDSGIPLLHDTYPGNRADATQFALMLGKLKSRYEVVTGRTTDITVTFDRGNNSDKNIAFLRSCEQPMHFVGGLTKAQVGDLFDIPFSDYVPLTGDRLSGTSAYRTKRNVFGGEYTVVVIHNPVLEAGQLQGIRNNIAKADAKLKEIQEKLLKRAGGEVKKGRRPTAESITKSVEAALKAEYMSDIFSYKVVEDAEGTVVLSYVERSDGLEKVRSRYLGKMALFTDRDDFTTEQIVLSYRAAWKIEAAFRQMKDTEHLSVRPIFHWTDEKINVHLFSCVLAYRLCCLAVKELADKGISITINDLLGGMSEIRRVTTFFGDLGGTRPQQVRTFSRGNETAEKICIEYGLKDLYGKVGNRGM